MILFPLLVTIFADQFADFGPDGDQLLRFEFGAILVWCLLFFDECYSRLFGSCILKSFLFQKFIFFVLKTDSSLLKVGGIVVVLLLLSLLCWNNCLLVPQPNKGKSNGCLHYPCRYDVPPACAGDTKTKRFQSTRLKIVNLQT